MVNPVHPPVHPDLIQARIDQARLEAQFQALEARLAKVESTLVNVHTLLTEARGGWKTLMAFGGAAAAVSAGMMHLLEKFWLK